MRPLAVGEVATWPAPLLKVEVENGSGTFVDYSAFIPVQSPLSLKADIDTPVTTGTLALRRVSSTGAVLAPLIGASPLNVDDVGAYSPALDTGRRVRISAAKRGTATYHELLKGRINRVDWSQDPITLDLADEGAWLADTQIKVDAVEYGTTPVGTALETVIQNILDATPSGKGVPTLYTPVSPGYAVTTWTQGRTKVLDAIRDLTLQATGWDVRFRYDAAGVSRLTLLDPSRDRTTVDDTIASVRHVQALDVDIRDIRNSGLAPYADGTVTASDAASITDHGERYFELPSSEVIRTEAEATAELATVLHDLSQAPADFVVEVDFRWNVQLYDRYTFPAMPRFFDTAQTFAVVGVAHTFDGGHAVTILTLSARVIGAYDAWHRRIITPTSLDGVYLTDLRETDTDTTATISFVRGLDVAEVWAAFTVVAVPVNESDWDTVVAALTPLAAGVNSYTVTRPLDQQATLVQLVPYREDGTAGTVVRRVLYGVPQVPTAEYDDVETATTGTQFVSLTERGIAVVSVEAQLQYEDSSFTAFAAPTRGPGAASVVKGGTLGANQYEQDVPLSGTKGRQTFIRYRWTLANGLVITSPDFAFDADQLPNVVSVIVDGTTIRATGDSDTKSMLVGRSDGVWQVAVDGQAISVDVAQADPDGTAGLASGESNTFVVQAWNVPAAFRVGAPVPGRAFDERQVRASNGAIPGDGSTVASWVTVTATAPTADGVSSTIAIGLKANAAPSGWTVKLLISTDGSVPTVNETANVSPALSSPPTALTSYTWDTGHACYTPGGLTPTKPITVRVKAELLDGTAVVRDTRDVEVTFYTNRDAV